MAERKYRYGLSNTHYALYDKATGTYGAVKPFPWAVALTLSIEGGDQTVIRADDTIADILDGNNDGYSGDLEMLNIPDSVRVDLLGEVYDEATGMQFEDANAEFPEFALITEMKTNAGPMAFTFYNVKASRPEIAANTKGETVEVDNETLPVRVSPRMVTYGGVETSIVQTHIQKTAANAAKYAAAFASVVIPGVAGSVKPSVALKPSTTLTVGEEERLVATTVPSGATVTWASADSAKVTVEDGVVKGVAVTTSAVNVTASITVNSQTYSDTCAVTVQASA